jgi:hypothetical protein
MEAVRISETSVYSETTIPEGSNIYLISSFLPPTMGDASVCELLEGKTPFMSRVSSVSIVSGYGLDNRANEVRSPAGAKDFSCSLCVQTGSGAHPASCPMGTGGPFPGAKARPGRDADHSPLSSAEVENE